MKRCPITYLASDCGHYSRQGLRMLSPKLNHLHDFPYGKDRQMEFLLDYSDKLSFSGVQPKLSAKLNIREEIFEVVKSGNFILKLPRDVFPELPQNEDLTMKLAATVGIEVPKHGMIYAIDGSLIYFIERFDRKGKRKIPTEDFGQLAGLWREKKYDFSMEKVVDIIDQFCTFPILEKGKLFRLVLFNFLTGNEDMHVKNFSLITDEQKTQLTPAYDLVNSTIVMNSTEEIALTLRGKKSNLKKNDFIDYFGKERLLLPTNIINEIVEKFRAIIPSWGIIINNSFLSQEKKEAYINLVKKRAELLF